MLLQQKWGKTYLRTAAIHGDDISRHSFSGFPGGDAGTPMEVAVTCVSGRYLNFNQRMGFYGCQCRGDQCSHKKDYSYVA